MLSTPNVESVLLWGKLALRLLSISLIPSEVRAAADSPFWDGYTIDTTSHGDYAKRTYGAARDGGTESQAVAAYITIHSSPTDTLLMWGTDSTVQVLARRRSPTSLEVSHLLTLSGSPLSKYQQQFFAEVSRSPPKYVVVDCRAQWGMTHKTGYENLTDFPLLQSFLREYYYPVEYFGGYDLWALK
jgi:hypothetical protein